MIPLNYILRKCTGGYKLYKSQEKNQPPNVHRQYQTICQKWERIRNSNTGSIDIQSRYRDGIYHKNVQC